jgi:hypothetical protein
LWVAFTYPNMSKGVKGMSEFDDWDDENEDARGDDIPELRKAYRKLQKQNKELAEQLQGMSKSVRERSVKDVLQAKGLPEKIAAFIPESVSTADEVENWITEYGDVFGVKVESEQEQAAPQPPSPELEALGRISSTQQSGQPFTNDPDQIAGLIAAARTPEELNQILFGSTTGPQAS